MNPYIAKNYDNNAVNTSSAASDSVILDLDDIHQETELVYSITVNHHGKYVVRLRLALDNVPKKGTSSSTSSDFFLENPILDLRGKVPEIQVHASFYDYLHKYQLKVHQARKTNEPTIPSSLKQLFMPALKKIHSRKNIISVPGLP
jgi:hypothetical protein